MSKLIDVDELIEIIEGSENLVDWQKGELIECVNACDTAYDVDAVVEQLEIEKQTSTSSKTEAIIGMCGASANHYCGEEYAYQRAIEIVKSGVLVSLDDEIEREKKEVEFYDACSVWDKREDYWDEVARRHSYHKNRLKLLKRMKEGGLQVFGKN